MSPTDEGLRARKDSMMTQEELELFGNLPSSEQLMQFYALRSTLENSAEAERRKTSELKKTFCNLILKLSPDLLESRDVALVQRICPEEWKKYCDTEWGTPEELQDMEDERLEQARLRPW